MITAELIQQTESRFAQRQAIRQERLAKIRSGAILDANEPEQVKERLQHLTRQAIETEGVGIPAPGQPAAPAAVVLERIIGKNDLVSISYLEAGLRVARTVGRVHVRDPDGTVVAYGTGFMVSPRLLLTNNHVLENASVAGASRVEFNFQEGLDKKLLSSEFVDFDSAAFFVTDKALDFSLVALRSSPKYGWNGLSGSEGKLIVGEYVTIIQHPEGQRKQIALRENQVIDILDNFVHYQTDTAPGSSGSPVFNDQWEIVALHHSGVPEKDSQGRILARNGSVWNSGMGEDAIHWISNEGIRISKILANVQGLSLTGGQATLRKQMIDGPKGWTAPTREVAIADSLRDEAGRAARYLTVPLRLTIDMGEAASGATLPQVEAGSAAPAGNDGSEQAGPAQDQLVEAWRAYQGAGRPTESAPVAPPQPPSAPADSALEWLTGQSRVPSTMAQQFAQNGAGR
jgi:V8-like Glu-specific endopeptidase